jgi:hypothetical protein
LNISAPCAILQGWLGAGKLSIFGISWRSVFRIPQSRPVGALLPGFQFLIPGGGLPNGAITELIAPQISAGSASLISAFVQFAYQRRYFVALIDGRDSFDPGPLGNACLRHLLWVRCQKALQVMQAADLLLRDRNFPVVIADMVLNPVDELRKIPQTTWYRLQRLVEPASTAFLVLTRRSMVGSAQLKIVLDNVWSLECFDQENPLSSLKLRLERSHLHETQIGLVKAS